MSRQCNKQIVSFLVNMSKVFSNLQNFVIEIWYKAALALHRTCPLVY